MGKFFILIALLLLIPVVALAQFPDQGFDFGQLGVDVVVVGIIIGFVQFFKKWLPVKLPWLPIVIAAVLCMIYAVVTNLSQPVDTIFKLAFAYATAAAWSYEFGKSVFKSIKKPE